MRINSLFKRVAIDLGVVLAAALLIVGCIVGYAWIKERPQRAESRKHAEAFLADLTAQRNGLIALGEVNLDPTNLTLANLQQYLHQPPMKKAGSQSKTRLGWACGQAQCSIWAFFLVPFGQEIPPNVTPAVLMVMSPPFGDFHNVSVGGVHLGDRVEGIREIRQKRGYGRPIGYNRMSWSKDWSFGWGEVNGKVVSLTLLNEEMMKTVEAGGDGNHTGLVSTRKGDAK
jgi:hypothetical protein